MRTRTTALIASATVMSLASHALAQRGGRQGGPGNGPPQQRCLNPNMAAGIQITKGQPIAEQYGVDPANGVIVIRPNGDASQFIQPCSNFPPPDDPFAKQLFPPDLVLSHQQAINLSDAQRTTITQAMVAAQVAMLTAQVKTSLEVEKLQGLLQANPVDEAKVLDEVDRVLALERDVKRSQLSLMIHIKNTLTPQQQEALNRLRGAQ